MMLQNYCDCSRLRQNIAAAATAAADAAADDDDDAVRRYKPAPEAQLMKAFQTLDTEGQGFLTQEQLSKLMMEEGDRMLHYIGN